MGNSADRLLFNLTIIIIDDGLAMHACIYMNTWWRHDMETLPALLVFYERN